MIIKIVAPEGTEEDYKKIGDFMSEEFGSHKTDRDFMTMLVEPPKEMKEVLERGTKEAWKKMIEVGMGNRPVEEMIFIPNPDASEEEKKKSIKEGVEIKKQLIKKQLSDKEIIAEFENFLVRKGMKQKNVPGNKEFNDLIINNKKRIFTPRDCEIVKKYISTIYMAFMLGYEIIPSKYKEDQNKTPYIG